MKSANEILVAYMWEKFDLMKDRHLMEDPKMILSPYFTKEDAEDILSWPLREAEAILNILRNNYKHEVTHDMATCPFCIRIELIHLLVSKTACRRFCGYGERHGICGRNSQPNDYDLWYTFIPNNYHEEKILSAVLEDL
jgi:hypothetical protein